MKAAVRAAFVPFSAPLEGVVPFMYLDVKGLVTSAIGNLIEPIGDALALPFRRPDGTLANHAEIAAEWERVKARQDLRLRGGMIFKSVTTLRLDNDGIVQVVNTTLDRMDRQLARRFRSYEDWPADAQLATLSMAWACGPAFHFPLLEAALLDQDFVRASNECTISTVGNPGVKPRNERNRLLYRNAATVVASGMLGPGLDRETLYWPRDMEAELAADTRPEGYRAEQESAIVHPFHFRDDDEPPPDAA